MAKRMVDTKKFEKEWFRKLPIKMKVAWDYLTCRCDHAGFWDIDLDRMRFDLGASFSLDEIREAFDVVIVAPDKLFIPGFIPFQYGCEISELNPDNRVQKSVLSILAKQGPIKPHASPFDGAKDKDKDKDKEKDKEKGECEGGFDFESLYAVYPRREGRASGMARLRKRIRSQYDFDRFAHAVRRYASACRTENRKREHILLWSSFVGTPESERWLDYAPLVSPPPSPAIHLAPPAPEPIQETERTLSPDEAARFRDLAKSKFRIPDQQEGA